MSWQRILKRTVFWAGVGIAFFILLLMLLFGFLQTDIGKHQITKVLTAGLRDSGNIQIEWGEFKGVFPFHFQVDHLVLKYPIEEWITIEDLSFHWSLLKLLKGRIYIRELTASLIRVNRIHKNKEVGSEAPRKLPSLPPFLYRLQVDSLAVQRLILKTSDERGGVFALNARIIPVQDISGHRADLRLIRMDGPKTEATLKSEWRYRKSLLRLRANVEEDEGGFIADFMGFSGPTRFTLDGEGPLEAWKGNLNAAMGGLGAIQTNLNIDLIDTPGLNAQGLIRINTDLLPAQARRHYSGDVHFAIALRQTHNQSIVIDSMDVAAGDITLKGKGSLDFEKQSAMGRITAHCGSLEVLKDMTGIETKGDITVNSSFSGSFSRPQIKLLLNTQQVGSDAFTADAFSAEFNISFPGDSMPVLSGMRIIGSGNIKNGTIQHSTSFPEMDIHWNLDLEGRSKETIQVHEFHLSGNKTEMDISGLFNLVNLSGTGKASFIVEDLRQFSGFFNTDLSGRNDVHMTFKGNASDRTFNAGIRGSLKIHEIPSFPVPSLSKAPVNYRTELNLTEDGKIQLSDFEMETVVGNIAGRAILDVMNKTIDSTWRVVVPKLASFSPIIHDTLDGSLEVDGDITGSYDSPHVRLNARAENLLFRKYPLPLLKIDTDTRGLPPKIKGDATFAATLEQGEVTGGTTFSQKKSTWNLSPLFVRMGENHLQGRLSLNTKTWLAIGELQGKAPRLSDLPILFGKPLKGSADFKVEFKEVSNEQHVRLDLAGRNVETHFGNAEKVAVSAGLINPFTDLRGNFRAEGRALQFGEVKVATVEVDGEGSKEKIHIQVKTGGRYTYDFDAKVAATLYPLSENQKLELRTFSAHYNDTPLELLHPITIYRSKTGYSHEKLSLRVGKGYLESTGRLKDQNVTVAVDFKNLSLEDIPFTQPFDLRGRAAGRFLVSGSVTNPQGSLELLLDNVRRYENGTSRTPPANLTLNAEFTDSRLKSEVAVEGFTHKPSLLRWSMPLNLTLFPFVCTFPWESEIKGDVKTEIDLKQMRELFGGEEDSTQGLVDFNLKLGGTGKNPKIEAIIHGKEIKYKGIGSKKANATIRFLGPLKNPEGSASLQFETLTFQGQKNSEHMPAALEAGVEWKDGQLRSDISMRGLSAKPLGIHLEIPLAFTFPPVSWSFPSQAELRGSIDGDVDLGHINRLLGSDMHIIKGNLGLNFMLKGTKQHPKVTGKGQFRQGYYEFVTTGTVLKDSEADITAEIPRIVIHRARASDGEEGEIFLNGRLDLVPDERFPFQWEIAFNRATLLRRDEITATTGGRVFLNGSLDQAKLSGQLQIEHAEFRIPDQLPPEITDLEVIEIHESARTSKRLTKPRSNKDLQLLLDLEVDGPGKIFVRGRGLDSEWKCNLRTTGSAREPEITGNLSVMRGSFDFFGKRFDIREGIISFTGSSPPAPHIDVRAEARTSDMTAKIHLTGSPKNPKLALSSDPDYPSDEILSRLLFGRTLREISPFQALTLANAATTLRGGGGLDFMGQMRRLFGVDRLEIKTDDEDPERGTLGAGKYINDKVYLEVERGSDSKSSKASVQVEVSPHIDVESEIGADAKGGIGIRWKWDY